MPIKQGYEQFRGKRMGYYQWNGGEKYHYTPGNERARKRAKRKAEKQQAAAYASGYDG
jgi:hypothetical protein